MAGVDELNISVLLEAAGTEKDIKKLAHHGVVTIDQFIALDAEKLGEWKIRNSYTDNVPRAIRQAKKMLIMSSDDHGQELLVRKTKYTVASEQV